MTKDKLPWMKFYPKDWLSDPELSQCTVTARGVWVDLLSAMHVNGRVGTIAGSAVALARTARCTEAELRAAIDELKATGTASVTEDNGKITVVNRRMEREHNAREAGKRRALAYRERQRHSEVTPNVTAQKSEVRSQKSEQEGIEVDDNTFSLTSHQQIMIGRDYPDPGIPESKAFKAFWKRYKKDIDRGKCWRLWHAWQLDTLAPTIMEVLTEWKQSQRWANRDFKDDPYNWLFNKRWESHPDISEANRG